MVAITKKLRYNTRDEIAASVVLVSFDQKISQNKWVAILATALAEGRNLYNMGRTLRQMLE